MIWLFAGRVPEHNIPCSIVLQPFRFVNAFVRGHGAQRFVAPQTDRPGFRDSTEQRIGAAAPPPDGIGTVAALYRHVA